MFGFLGKLVRNLWRLILPQTPTMFSVVLKTLAADVVKSYMARNPNTKNWANLVLTTSKEIESLLHVQPSTAERVVWSVLYDLGVVSITDDQK